jgi:hypothetical protein
MPFMYSIMFSATFESWLAGVLSPYILLMLISLSVISQLQPVEAMNKEEQKEFQNDTVAAARI